MAACLVLGVPTQIFTFGFAPSFQETAVPSIYLRMCIIKALTNSLRWRAESNSWLLQKHSENSTTIIKEYLPQQHTNNYLNKTMACSLSQANRLVAQSLSLFHFHRSVPTLIHNIICIFIYFKSSIWSDNLKTVKLVAWLIYVGPFQPFF